MMVSKAAALRLSSLGSILITIPLQFAGAFTPQLTPIRVPTQRSPIIRIFCDSCDMSGDDIKILGICGGIGSGKSTACKLMVDALGCIDRIDADLLAHGVYEPGSQSLKDIVAEFGQDILSNDATIDRKKLGAIVFSDNNAMTRLEHIVWPHVRTKIEDQIRNIKQHYASRNKHSETNTNNIIIVEAALLLETNWHDLLDGLWVIQSSPSVAVQRLKDNRGLTKEEAMTRIIAQQKRRGIGNTEDANKFKDDMEQGDVTAVITNDGTLETLQAALGEALKNPSSFKR